LAIDHSVPRQRTATRRGQERAAGVGEGQLARYNLGSPFRSKAYYAEALREYRAALERGEERDLVLQAMAELSLAAAARPKEALALIYDDC
jgi:hypothetical protein